MNKKFLSRKGVEEILAILTREAEVPVKYLGLSLSVADHCVETAPRGSDGLILRKLDDPELELELSLTFRFWKKSPIAAEKREEAKPEPEQPDAVAAAQSEAGWNDCDFRKFRVYDREQEWYLDPENIVMTPDGRILQVFFADPDICAALLDPLDGERYEVELSTGCRDRSGKLIYEGDICDDHGTLYVIKRDEAFGVAPHLQPFKTDDPKYGNWNYEGGMPKDTADPIHGVDVIGNIHENPYLVKGLEE